LTDKDYYVVQKGETLAGISKKLYGDTSHVKAICKMNGLSDGNLIYIGQKLLLP
jgi:nucleoid-associated protein YgaU